MILPGNNSIDVYKQYKLLQVSKYTIMIMIM